MFKLGSSILQNLWNNPKTFEVRPTTFPGQARMATTPNCNLLFWTRVRVGVCGWLIGMRHVVVVSLSFALCCLLHESFLARCARAACAFLFLSVIIPGFFFRFRLLRFHLLPVRPYLYFDLRFFWWFFSFFLVVFLLVFGRSVKPLKKSFADRVFLARVLFTLRRSLVL